MMIVRKYFVGTDNKLDFAFECDCDEFKNNTARTCKHMKDLDEYLNHMVDELRNIEANVKSKSLNKNPIVSLEIA